MPEKYKLVVYVPVSHTGSVLKAIGDAGGGALGNYTHCSFTSRGTGRYLPGEKANPFIGQKGVLESVEEDRIETMVLKDRLARVILAMKAVHPYEEVAFDIYKIEDFEG